jgi:hypothetical protein
VEIHVEFDEYRWFDFSIHETEREGMVVICFLKVNVLEGDKTHLIPNIIMDEEEPRNPNHLHIYGIENWYRDDNSSAINYVISANEVYGFLQMMI